MHVSYHQYRENTSEAGTNCKFLLPSYNLEEEIDTVWDEESEWESFDI